MAGPKYLLGGGERLSEDISRASRDPGEKAYPYSFEEARDNLATEAEVLAQHLRELPVLGKPRGQAVVAVTLHPTFLAKTFYPASLLRTLKLRHVGSRSAHIIPRVRSKTQARWEDRLMPAPVLYLAGAAEELARFFDQLQVWDPSDENLRNDFRRIEHLRDPGPDRLKGSVKSRVPRDGQVPVEVVLHAGGRDDEFVVSGFERFAASRGLKPLIERRLYSGGLCFVPMLSPINDVPGLLDYSFVRALRSVPRIGPLDPTTRGLVQGFRVQLPKTGTVAASETKVAIFDGGLPTGHALGSWVDEYDATGVGAPVATAQQHGLMVTSAYLFGPLEHSKVADTPPSRVDHWRVLGADTADNDFTVYSVLARIEDVLTARHYDFVNISMGPDQPMDDDPVDLWTSKLDSLLAHGETVATVACGNNGEDDAVTGLNRIQPPADGVNVLGVGAAGATGPMRRRAFYSPVGPGRSPGYVKPDVLSFGGSFENPFLVVDNVGPLPGGGTLGTSFAAPLTLRSAAGIHSTFTEKLWAPTLKALMVHQAKRGDESKAQVGWGHLSHDVSELVICGDGEAHVIYQRQMPTTGGVRMYLPVPPGLRGNVEIRATFCFYCDVDPEDAISYTRGGLDIQFRPNSQKFSPPYSKDGKLIASSVPKAEAFFQASDFYTPEHIRRADAHKWETTLSVTRTKQAALLHLPAFDVAYGTRSHGHGGSSRPPIKFALVLTLRNKHEAELYEKVIIAAGQRLQALRPRVQVPVPITV